MLLSIVLAISLSLFARAEPHQLIEASNFSEATPLVATAAVGKPIHLYFHGTYENESVSSIMAEVGAVFLAPLNDRRSDVLFSFIGSGKISPGKPVDIEVRLILEARTEAGQQFLLHYVKDCENHGIRKRPVAFQTVERILFRFALNFGYSVPEKSIDDLIGTSTRSFPFSSIESWLAATRTSRAALLAPKHEDFLEFVKVIAKQQFPEVRSRFLKNSNYALAVDQTQILLADGSLAEPYEHSLSGGIAKRKCFDPSFENGYCD